MNKEEIEKKKQSYYFIVSAIYKWCAETVVSSNGELNKDDFYIISENIFKDLKSNLTKEAEILFNITKAEFENKLSENLLEQTKKEIGW